MRGTSWTAVHGLGGLIVISAALVACGGSDVNVTRIQSIGESRIADEDDVRFLLDRLENGVEEERLSAAWALGQTGRTDKLDALAQAASEDPSSDVRINAIASLDLLGGEAAEASLFEFLDDEDEAIRAAALRGLADSSSPEIVPRVGPLLADGGAATRALAVDVLGRSGNPDAVPYLEDAADNPDPDIRSRVAFGLGKLRDPSATATLIPMLEDEQWEVRANAAQALGMIGDPDARPAIEPLTDDPNSMVRQAAEAALDKLP
jgi:HEAT repeat protein